LNVKNTTNLVLQLPLLPKMQKGPSKKVDKWQNFAQYCHTGSTLTSGDFLQKPSQG
jgi:hypothetical protein